MSTEPIEQSEPESPTAATDPGTADRALVRIGMAAVAAVPLVVGGLNSLQTATILVALPFVVVMLFLCWALLKELREDPGAGPSRHHAMHGLQNIVRTMVGDAVTEQSQTRRYRLRRAAKSRTESDDEA